MTELLDKRRQSLEGAAKDDYERSQVESRFTLNGTIAVREEQVSGTPDEILEVFDRRTYDRLSFRIKGEYEKEHLGLVIRRWRWRTRGTPPRVLLSVKASDPDWVAQVLARLSREIDIGKPKWSWLHRSGWTRILLPLLIALALNFSITPAVNRLTAANGFSSAASFIVSATVAVICGIVGGAFAKGDWLLNLLLPPIEVLADNEKPSGTRFLIAVLGIVIVPVVLKLLGLA